MTKTQFNISIYNSLPKCAPAEPQPLVTISYQPHVDLSKRSRYTTQQKVWDTHYAKAPSKVKLVKKKKETPRSKLDALIKLLQ